MQSATPPPFKLGISLTGGVSTGAYLAGALDFIVEALDAFEDAKSRQDRQAPPHGVSVETICGASSGALTAGVAAASLRHAFAPVTEASDGERRAANPFFDAWVNMTGAAELLGTGDEQSAGLRSLLDGSSLERVTDKAIAFGPGHSIRDREWVADPLRICFSVTNVEGVGYAVPANAMPIATQYVQHAEVLRFNIACGPRSTGVAAPWSDETTLRFPSTPSAARSSDWQAFARAAIASSAFPVVLPSQSITRSRGAYALEKAIIPGGPGDPAVARPLVPTFRTDDEAITTFTAVDGGIVDNSPVDLARAVLNGRDVLARNERDGERATKAIVMIDPMLADGSPARRRAAVFPFLSDVGPLLSALMDQARFRPDEVALAQDPDVFSRYLIAPTRDDGATFGSRNLAGASCFAFGGYLSKSFREHDYFLGRCNAQAYLADHLTLPAGNALFHSWRNDPMYSQWVTRYANAHGQLPIVPLIGHLHPRERPLPLPEWPVGQADLAEIGTLLENRFDFIHRKLVDQWKPAGAVALIGKVVEALLWNAVRRGLRKKSVDLLEAQLRACGLARS